MRGARSSTASARVRAAASVVTLLVAITPARPARADKVADAEDLFRRAKALVAQGKLAEACPMFKESYRSDPAPGTLLNLALCDEQTGRIAAAWGEFRVVEQQSRAAVPPREDRIALAREHAEKLERRLSRIKLLVPPAAQVPGLVVKVDGEEKAQALWSAGIVVDVGTRLIEASAPHKKTASIKVKIDDEGVVQSVSLVPLDDAVEAAAAGGARGVDLERVEEYASSRARRTTGYVVGGVGLVTLATGAVFGILAITNNNQAKECASPCTRGLGPADASDQATDRALVFANVANVLVPLGVIGAGLGTYLVLSSGPSSAVKVSPRASASGGGLDLAGTW